MNLPASNDPAESEGDDITAVLSSEEDEAGSITLVNRIEKGLARMPLARLTTVAPRTARWAIESVLTEAGKIPGAPQIRMTAALAAQVAMDEAVVALMQGPNRTPRRADYERVSAELSEARALFDERGWLDDPRSYHRDPDPLTDVSFSSGWALGQRYQRMNWDSGYHARTEEPGAQRWEAFEKNHTASAWLLQHDDGPRPWVVCVHGFGTGSPFSDMITFRAQHLHHDLGWNVAAIVLPVHGSRSPSRMGGEQFLSFDMVNSVHALAQSAWDVRRLLSWVRAQDPTSLVLHGVSLGGYVSALTTCLDGDLDAVIAGIPICDFPALFAHQSPKHVRERAAEHHVLGGNAEIVHQVVSPLAMPTLVPHDRRFIFAGLGDRMAIPAQTQALWQHWDQSTISWFPGNHVGYLWSKKVAGFVDGIFEDLSPESVAKPDG